MYIRNHKKMFSTLLLLWIMTSFNSLPSLFLEYYIYHGRMCGHTWKNSLEIPCCAVLWDNCSNGRVLKWNIFLLSFFSSPCQFLRSYFIKSLVKAESNFTFHFRTSEPNVYFGPIIPKVNFTRIYTKKRRTRWGKSWTRTVHFQVAGF